MKAFLKFARQVAWGAATGLGISLVLMLFGFIGGGGWQAARASRALAFAAMAALVGVLALVATVGPFKFLFHKLSQEDFARKESMLPFTVSLAITVLVVWVYITPPTI